MNDIQQHWYHQVRSDFEVYKLLQNCPNIPICHSLHYLQMLTEKLSKAFITREESAVTKTHKGFVTLLKKIYQDKSIRDKLIKFREDKSKEQFAEFLRKIKPLASYLEHLAPDLAGDGPNPEYPWPVGIPEEAPSTFNFQQWKDFYHAGLGRQFIKFLDILVNRFPEYAE